MKGIALLAYLSVLDLIGTRVLVCLIEGRGCCASGGRRRGTNSKALDHFFKNIQLPAKVYY